MEMLSEISAGVRRRGDRMMWVRALAGVVMAFAFVVPARAQDLMRFLDLSSPDMTSAEMTRADVETALASHQTDFSAKKLSGLDLSGLDLSGVQLRAARRNLDRVLHE
jgi:hypothetical protein